MNSEEKKIFREEVRKRMSEIENEIRKMTEIEMCKYFEKPTNTNKK